VSVGTDPHAGSQVIEQERRRIGRHLDDIARLAETDVPPSTFYGEVLKRLLDALAAPAGAVWLRTIQGTPQLHYQVNLNQTGTERDEQSRQSHEGLLMMALHQAQPQGFHLLPNTTVNPGQDGRAAPGNPTGNLLLIVPVLQNDQTVGLLEVFQNPNRPLNAVPGFLQYMSLMADLCARYLRNQRMTLLAGQQQLWTQMEAYARQIHGSLNPTEVSYVVANEGRRLVECDRVSVAIRYGPRTAIEAVSGADVVEKRSNLVKLMRTLCDRVLQWGEKLVFQGTQDDSLPPKVLSAMNDYLHESNSKLLVVQPLKDEREGKDSKAPARAAVVMECFEPPAEVQPLLDRLDVVTRHATSALYNAVEYRRIPMRFLWMPIAKAQEGLGGKSRFIWAMVLMGLAGLIAAMVLVPYPLKMDANGRLLPVVRGNGFSPSDAKVVEFLIRPGAVVPEDAPLALLYDQQQKDHLLDLGNEIWQAHHKEAQRNDAVADLKVPEADRQKARGEAADAKRLARAKEREKDELEKLLAAVPQKAGYFLLKAPEFSDQDKVKLRNFRGVRQWTILSSDFEDNWKGKHVKPTDPIISFGLKEGPWEIELKIPQKHIGQVLAEAERERARMKAARKEELKKTRKVDNIPDNDPALKIEDSEVVLQVDFLLRSDPTRTYRGLLHRNRIAAEATPQKDESSEAEPVVMAFVDIESSAIPAEQRLDRRDRVAGTEVHGKILCGYHRMGYSLFYGVWEFMYEKVVFFF